LLEGGDMCVAATVGRSETYRENYCVMGVFGSVAVLWGTPGEREGKR